MFKHDIINIGTEISIHAPRRGSDYYYRNGEFYTSISIHAPRRGSDEQQYWAGR